MTRRRSVCNMYGNESIDWGGPPSGERQDWESSPTLAAGGRYIYLAGFESNRTAAIRYTYRDYLTFPDDLRCEIINGKVFGMTPSPTSSHQRVSGKLYRLIGNRLEEQAHACQVFIAPLDVVITEDQVVQPDVFIVCDRQEIERTPISGAPDAVFEISSPSTLLKDRREKMELYERSGVGEYFISPPSPQFVRTSE